MQFSMARLLVSVLVVNVLLCLAFVVPSVVGVPLLTLCSLVVLPPFVIVGVFNTRKARQAFFLGCMVAGTPHFIYSVYLAVMVSASFSDLSFYDDGGWSMQLFHLGGYFIGALGGLSGVGSYYLITSDEKAANERTIEEKQHFDDFSNEGATHPLDEEPVVRLPK